MGDALAEFARQNDLSYVENGSLPRVGSGFTMGAATVKGIAGGDLPGGLYGVIAWSEVRENPTLREGVVSEMTFGLKGPKGLELRSSSGGEEGAQYVRQVGVLLTRVPESLTWLPYLVCKEDRKRGALDRIFGPGGMIKIVKEVEFESINFERKYRVGVMAGPDGENKVKQLFSPTFVDWLADHAPEDLYFELGVGMLRVRAPSREASIEDARTLCEFGARVAERIHSELAEIVGLPDRTAGRYDQAMERRKRKLDEELGVVQFDEPPTSVENAAKAYRKRTRGVLGLGGKEKARKLAYLAVMRAYCEPRGLEFTLPMDFIIRLSTLELPKTELAYLAHGPIPGVELTGVFVSIDYSEKKDKSVLAPAVFLERRSVDSAPVIRVLPDDGTKSALLGGFRVKDPSGERVMSESDHRSADAAAELERNGLNGGYKVEAALTDEGSAVLPETVVAWLRAQDGKGTVLLDGANAILIGAPAPAEDWSHEWIDGFFAAAAEPLRALSA